MKKLLPLFILFVLGSMTPVAAQEVDSTAVVVPQEGQVVTPTEDAPPTEQTEPTATEEPVTTEEPTAQPQTTVKKPLIPLVQIDELTDTGDESESVVYNDSEQSLADAQAKEKAAEEEDMWFVTKKELYARSVRKSWEYRLNLCFNTSTGTSAITSDESGGFDLGIGYNFNGSVYAGLLTGFWHDFGGVSAHYAGDAIPAFGDLQFRWNVRKRLSVFVEGYAGILLAVSANDVKPWAKTFEYPNYMCYGVSPGLMVRTGKNLDFRFSVGYGYAKPIDETAGYGDCTYDETLLCFKAGFAYRFKRK